MTKNKKTIEACLCCGESNKRRFYKSRNTLYNNIFEHIPYCVECIEERYKNIFQRYEDNYKAMNEICKELNIPFEDTLFDMAKKEMETLGTLIVSAYLKKYNSTAGKKFGLYYADSTFFSMEESDCDEEEVEIDKDTIFYWGRGYSAEDYEYLYWLLEKWKKDTTWDNYSEETLAKEICIKQLELEKEREKGGNTKDLLRDLDMLMKTAGVDPAKANTINAGRNKEAFGAWIKDIEEKRPAEWYDDLEKYQDVDNMKEYINNHLLRAVKNFITGSRDFNMDFSDTLNEEG